MNMATSGRLNDAGVDCGGLTGCVSVGGVVGGGVTGGGELGAGATIVTHAAASMAINNILISAFFISYLPYLSVFTVIILTVTRFSGLTNLVHIFLMASIISFTSGNWLKG